MNSELIYDYSVRSPRPVSTVYSHLSHDVTLVPTFYSFRTWAGSPLPYAMYNLSSLCKCGKIVAIPASPQLEYIVLQHMTAEGTKQSGIRRAVLGAITTTTVPLFVKQNPRKCVYTEVKASWSSC